MYERSYAADTPQQRQAVHGECRSAPDELFFERLLDQVNPQRPALDTSVAQARIYAGRWLALRRIRRGLSTHQIEERTGIVPPTLLLLETGLADDTLAPAEAWGQLGAVLAGRRGVEPHVAAVVDVALGRANTMRSSTMAQVGGDLLRYDRAPRDALARTLRKHRKGLALLGLVASAVAFWRRRPPVFRRTARRRPARSHVPIAPVQAVAQRSHANDLQVPLASHPLRMVKLPYRGDERRCVILWPNPFFAGMYRAPRTPPCSKKPQAPVRGLVAQRSRRISIDFRLKLSRGGL